jgi:hypothetical protein
MQGRHLLHSASMSNILLSGPGLSNCQVQNPEMIHHKLRDRARQSLSLSIADSNQLGEEKFRKSADMVTSKAGGGRLRKLMRKFSLSRSADKCGNRPSTVPIWSISTPMSCPSADEIPPLPKHRVSVPLDLRIVNPSVLDQACHDEEDRSCILQSQSVPTTPKMPPEGGWTRTNSPDLDLAALPLPPHRAPKISTGLPSQSGIGTDNITSAMDLQHDSPNLISSGYFIPAISLSPPPHRPMTNPQRPNKHLFIGDTHLRLNKTPPLQRTHSGYSSEVRNTSSNYTITHKGVQKI